MELITHKITILTVNMSWGDYEGESDRWLSRHVTEWQEVSHEDFKFLEQGVRLHNSKNPNINLILIEQPKNQIEVLFNTIEEGKAYFKRIEESHRKYQEELQAKREREKKGREEKKAKTLADKKKLLEELQEEIAREERKKVSNEKIK